MGNIGEIINMISGSAKGKLTELGFTFKLSTPIFVLGKGTRLFKEVEYAPYICVPFSTEDQIQSLALGEKHSLMVSSRGEVYSWGDNSSGQLGEDYSISLNLIRRQ